MNNQIRYNVKGETPSEHVLHYVDLQHCHFYPSMYLPYPTVCCLLPAFGNLIIIHDSLPSSEWGSPNTSKGSPSSSPDGTVTERSTGTYRAGCSPVLQFIIGYLIYIFLKDLTNLRRESLFLIIFYLCIIILCRLNNLFLLAHLIGLCSRPTAIT